MYSEQCPGADYSMPKISTALYLTEGTKGSATAGTIHHWINGRTADKFYSKLNLTFCLICNTSYCILYKQKSVSKWSKLKMPIKNVYTVVHVYKISTIINIHSGGDVCICWTVLSLFMLLVFVWNWNTLLQNGHFSPHKTVIYVFCYEAVVALRQILKSKDKCVCGNKYGRSPSQSQQLNSSSLEKKKQ